jgi:hypothetical protein
MAQPDIKPAYQAEYISGNFWRMVMDIEEDVRVINTPGGIEKKITTRKLVTRKEQFKAGYMIYFPQGHSMFVAEDDREQLERLGILDAPDRVDMDTGERVPETFNLSPKEIVQRKTQNRPRPPGAHEVVTMEDDDA